MGKLQAILGVGGYTCDAAACLIVDGRLLGAIEEERFTRVKHQGGWPENSIACLLKKHNVSTTDITHVTFCYSPWLRLSRRLPYHLLRIPRFSSYSRRAIVNEVKFVRTFLRQLRQFCKESGAQFKCIRHHVAHAASAFYTSPFEEAALYTVDMRGEWDTCILGHGVSKRIRVIDKTSFPHSLGMFYAGITRHLGFGDNNEYKVMGLASYGTPTLANKLRDVIFPAGKGQFRINEAYFMQHVTLGMHGFSYFTDRFENEFGPARQKDESVTDYHRDLAASTQRVFEDCVFHQLRYLYEKTKCRSICVSGGCGLNGVMNGHIYSETPFEHVYVPPVAGDNGLGLGGALYLRHHVLAHDRGEPLTRADLGTSFTDDEIETVLQQSGLKWKHVPDIVPATVKLLEAGKIVAWFQGRMEFGARALGYRSILANPTLVNMKDKINSKVKFREDFRPFAPAVVEEKAHDYFEVYDPIPFMTVVCKVKPKGIQDLPATTHVDNTARVQTVSKENSPLFWKLIDGFGERTSTPVLLNTSFNIMGEPIVNTPEDAVKCFQNSGIDVLVMGNTISTK